MENSNSKPEQRCPYKIHQSHHNDHPAVVGMAKNPDPSQLRYMIIYNSIAYPGLLNTEEEKEAYLLKPCSCF
jgi:hypothetical protein